MLFIIIVIALVIVLDVTALRWGADSREHLNSPEWKRREWQEELFTKQSA